MNAVLTYFFQGYTIIASAATIARGYDMDYIGDLTTVEVADQLRVTQSAVTAWCRSGQLPAYRAGKHWRIRKEDLAVFVRRGIPKVAEGQRTTA